MVMICQHKREWQTERAACDAGTTAEYLVYHEGRQIRALAIDHPAANTGGPF